MLLLVHLYLYHFYPHALDFYYFPCLFFYKSTRRYNPGDRHRHLHRSKNLKSHLVSSFFSAFLSSCFGLVPHYLCSSYLLSVVSSFLDFIISPIVSFFFFIFAYFTWIGNFFTACCGSVSFHSCIVFGRSRVQVSARRSAICNEIFRGFP
jgi:hypothetical protein